MVVNGRFATCVLYCNMGMSFQCEDPLSSDGDTDDDMIDDVLEHRQIWDNGLTKHYKHRKTQAHT